MNESEFIDGYDPNAYERPSVAVDLVLIGKLGNRLGVLLRQREAHPFLGQWALPGGFVGIDEPVDAAAARVLRERAGMAEGHLEQLYTFGAVERDPRTRVVTVTYLALLRETAFAAALRAQPKLMPARLDVPWPGEAGGPVAARDAEGTSLSIAFDHADILALAVLRLRGKVDYSDVGFALLPELFTLRQLQDVHEAILGSVLNKPAFRRRMLDRGWLVATGAREEGTSHRPAELYRFERPL